MTPMRIPLQATNSELYSASKRLLEERQPLEGFSNDIPRASHGPNQWDVAGRVDFLAQAANVDVDQVGAGVEVIAPYLFENHHPRENLSGVAHQEFQQLVLGGQQGQQLTIAAGFVADQVQLKVRDPQRGGLGADRVL